MSNLPKNVELTLRYLQEVIRYNKNEMLVGSTNAFFDALFNHIFVLIKNNSNLIILV